MINSTALFATSAEKNKKEEKKNKTAQSLNRLQ